MRTAPTGMKFSELLRSDLVLVPLGATDKWAAIERLAAAPVAAGVFPADLKERVHDALVTRERSMTTGMEHGIAIPHAAVDGLPEAVAVLGLDRDGVPFEALDGKPARIIVCLIIPREQKLLHIKTLAGIAKMLGRAEVRDAILACDTGAQVVDVVAMHE